MMKLVGLRDDAKELKGFQMRRENFNFYKVFLSLNKQIFTSDHSAEPSLTFAVQTRRFIFKFSLNGDAILVIGITKKIV